MLLTVACQEKVIHILEQSVLYCLCGKPLRSAAKASPNRVGEFLNPWGKNHQMQPCQLHLMSHFWVSPLEGKKRLALQGQMEAEECIV
jgi:hypothetical protein